MSNLLSNAAKFSKLGGVVTVSAERHEQRVRVSICDKGEGIPETFHEKIFERFSQPEGSNIRKTGGTGLGLNIVKTIIEQHNGTMAQWHNGTMAQWHNGTMAQWHNGTMAQWHNGTMDFHSVLGDGTTFYFDLPLVFVSE